MALPDCDTLFTRYFLPWYRERDREGRAYKATRPDVEQLSVPTDVSASELSPLTAQDQEDVAGRVRKMFEAATHDWEPMLGLKGTPSLDWIAAFDRYFQRRRIQEILKCSDAQKYDNPYVVLCCELGAVLGTVLQALEPRLAWLYDWPYWESALYDQQSRTRVNVFHWAVKKMSEYAVTDGLAQKLEACRTILQKGT